MLFPHVIINIKIIEIFHTIFVVILLHLQDTSTQTRHISNAQQKRVAGATILNKEDWEKRRGPVYSKSCSEEGIKVSTLGSWSPKF